MCKIYKMRVNKPGTTDPVESCRKRQDVSDSSSISFSS